MPRAVEVLGELHFTDEAADQEAVITGYGRNEAAAVRTGLAVDGAQFQDKLRAVRAEHGGGEAVFQAGDGVAVRIPDDQVEAVHDARIGGFGLEAGADGEGTVPDFERLVRSGGTEEQESGNDEADSFHGHLHRRWNRRMTVCCRPGNAWPGGR